MNGTGLSDHDLGMIKACLFSYPEVAQAVLFGSRAKGNYKHHSNVDIAIKGKLTVLQCEALRQALEEYLSHTPST